MIELLHAPTAVMLRFALRWRPGIAIANVPCHITGAIDEVWRCS